MAWLQFGSVTLESLYERASTLLAAGQLDQAAAASIEAFGKLKELAGRGKPIDGTLVRRLFLLQGLVASRTGNHRNALECLIRAEEAIWSDAAAPIAAVISGAALEDLSPEASRIYLQFLSRAAGALAAPDRDRALRAAEHVMRPEPRRRHDFAVLKDLNQKVIAVAPQFAWPHLHLAMIEALEGKPANALPALERAMSIDPGSREAGLLAAVVHVEADRFADAKDRLGSIDAPDTSIGRLLIAAAIERNLGNDEAARRLFERADAAGPLPLESHLAWIEVLANVSAIAEARSQLGRLAHSTDQRVRILRHAIDAVAADDDRPALDALAVLLTDRAAATGAARAITWLASVRPQDDRIAALIERIPAASRSGRGEATRAVALAQRGRLTDALNTWKIAAARGETMPDSLRRSVVDALCQAYNSGDFCAAIDLAADLPADRALAFATAPVALAAIAGLLETGGVRDTRRGDLTGQLDRIARSCPEFWRTGAQASVLALAICQCDEPEKARHLLGDIAGAPAEVLLQLQAAELRSGDASKPPLVSQSHDGRAAFLDTLATALGHDLAVGIELAQRLDLTPDVAGLMATLRAAAGHWDDVEGLPPHSGSVVLWQAVARYRRGDKAGAEAQLAAVPDSDRARPRVNQMRAALILQRVQQALRQGGDADGYRDALVEAVRLVPGRDGPLGRFKGHPGAAHAALLAQDHESFSEIVERAAHGSGLEDIATAHTVALLDLVRALRAKGVGEAQGAVERIESAIAHMAAVLADPCYLVEWTDERIEAYAVAGSDIDVDEFEQSLLSSFAEMCLKAGATSVSSNGFAAPVDGVTFLDLLTRSELAGARLVAEHEELSWLRAELPAAAGPTLLARSGLGPALASFCDKLDLEHRTSRGEVGGTPSGTSSEAAAEELDDLLDRLAGREANGPAQDASETLEPSRPIRLAFSSLRLAAAALNMRQPEIAVKLLWAPMPACVSATSGACRMGPAGGCRDAGAATFGRCNPGFLGSVGADGLARAAADLECTILLAISEQRIMSASLQAAEIGAIWREALETASRCGQMPRVRAEIRRMALGRAKSLDADNREGEARDLLHAAASLVDDEVLRGHLSSVEANAGIMAANETGDFHGAVEKLRRALELNPHSTHARKNLLVAIRVHAQSLCRKSMPDAIRLLEDGSRIAHAWLREDSGNTELHDTIETLDDYLGLLRAASSGSKPQAAAASPAPAAAPKDVTDIAEGSPADAAKSDLNSLLDAARRRREAASKPGNGT